MIKQLAIVCFTRSALHTVTCDDTSVQRAQNSYNTQMQTIHCPSTSFIRTAVVNLVRQILLYFYLGDFAISLIFRKKKFEPDTRSQAIFISSTQSRFLCHNSFVFFLARCKSLSRNLQIHRLAPGSFSLSILRTRNGSFSPIWFCLSYRPKCFFFSGEALLM